MGILVFFILVAGCISFVVAAHVWWLPPLASRQGATADEIFNAILIATAVGFIMVHVFLGLALIRYSARRDRQAAHWHEHLGAEMAWTLAPAFGLLILAVFSEIVWAHVYSPPPANAQVVEVVARQFDWHFRYPTPSGQFGRAAPQFRSASNLFGEDPSDPVNARNLITTNDLHLIVNRPVELRITALDVIHSFFLPNFRVKQDAVPGRVITIWFTPDRVGTYTLACAQLCGVGHYTMHGNVTVQTQAQFDAWLRSQEKP